MWMATTCRDYLCNFWLRRSLL